VGKIPLIL